MIIPPKLDLRNMDCMDLMKEFPDKHFDLAIVDPPYGINIGANKSGMGRRKGDAKAKYDMGDWDSSPPDADYFKELFRISKNQIIWGANHFIDMIPIRSSCWIVWDKMFSSEVSFAQVELAWTSFDSTAKMFKSSPMQPDRIHPTQKPRALYSWLLMNYSKPGEKVFDSHLGSGSHAVSAHYFGVDLTASEIDKGYFDQASKRIHRETAQTELL